MEALWGVMTIVGPILLGLALIYAILANRRRSAADRRRTEEATRELYREEDRAEKAGETQIR